VSEPPWHFAVKLTCDCRNVSLLFFLCNVRISASKTRAHAIQ